MDRKQRKEIKAQIETAILETGQDIENLVELTRPVSPDNAIGRLSRMDAINNKNINQASLNTSRQKLNMLKRALSRIDEPDFGICADCENPIPLGRILIMPEATLCVRCAS